MRSMTDFIESREIGDSYSIYNEEYSWAEEYSEYYSEDSSSYLMPVFESSSYQFFGEATFYQEASHKGLIAGGILALVSGAFFMIMKLLKGGGGGGSSSSKSNKSSSSSSKGNKSGSSSGSIKKPSSDKQSSKPETEPKKKDNRTTPDTPVQSTTPKAEDVPKENPGTPSVAVGQTGGDVSGVGKPSKDESPKSQTSKDNPDKKNTQTTATLPELEDQEKIVFNVHIIMDALKKFKRENGNAGTPYDTQTLKLIYEGLFEVNKIVRDMVVITTDDLWYVVSSANIKDEAVLRFMTNKQKLNETISKLQSESKDLGNKVLDAKPDDIMDRLRDIDKLISEIEDHCKDGMKECSEKRKLEKYKKDVSNIDQVYKILNDVLKGINVVCKNIQNEFKTIRKSLWGKKYQTIFLYLNGVNGFGFEYESDDKEDKEYRFKRVLSKPNPDQMIVVFDSTLMIPSDNIKRLLLRAGITDREIDKWNNEHKQDFENRIKKARKAEGAMFKDLKKAFPDYERTFEDVENLATRQLDLVAALVNTPIEDALNKSLGEIPAAMQLKEFEDNLENSISDIVNKMLANKSETKKSKNMSPVDDFIQTIQSTMGTLESAMEHDASDQFGKFKSGFEKVVNEYQNDHNEKHLIDAVHGAINKYVYGSEIRFGNEAWNKVESWLENIGYKSINAKPGDSIKRIITYFGNPGMIPTTDKSQNDMIASVRVQPRILKIKIDGDTQTRNLLGKCSWYRYNQTHEDEAKKSKNTSQDDETKKSKNMSHEDESKKSKNTSHEDESKKSKNMSPVDDFIQTIQSTMGVLESAMEQNASYEFGRFKSGFEKAVNEYQNDPDEEDLIFAVHGAINKYVYGSHSNFTNEAWNRVESWFENIGYKSINAKPGDSIKRIRADFDMPIKALTSEKSQDDIIKEILLQPRILKIKIDGETVPFKLAGKCTYYVYKA